MSINDIKSEAARQDLRRVLGVIKDAGLHVHVTPPMMNVKPQDLPATISALVNGAEGGDEARFAFNGAGRTAFSIHKDVGCEKISDVTVDTSGDRLRVVSMSPNATTVEIFARAGVALPPGAADGISPEGNHFDTPEATEASAAALRAKASDLISHTMGKLDRCRNILKNDKKMVDALAARTVARFPVPNDPQVMPFNVPDWGNIAMLVQHSAIEVASEMARILVILKEVERLSKLIEPEVLHHPDTVGRRS